VFGPGGWSLEGGVQLVERGLTFGVLPQGRTKLVVRRMRGRGSLGIVHDKVVLSQYGPIPLPEAWPGGGSAPKRRPAYG